MCTSWAGTPAFLAPEVAAGLDEFEGAPVDVWALGVSLYRMLLGSMPFWSLSGSEIELFDNIVHQQLVLTSSPDLDETPAISAEATAVLKRLLSKNPQSRVTLKQLRGDNFVTRCGTISLPPSQRGGRCTPTTEQVENAVTRWNVHGLASTVSKIHGRARRASTVCNSAKSKGS